MKHWEKKANGWVFLSHASADYQDVKIIRDYLEESGFSALMFYLKCLEDEDKKDSIKQLLEWEIKARNIFVLCNSEAAKSSPWVKWEINFVKDLPAKIFKEINIENLKYKKCTELSKLDQLVTLSTLYFLYSHEDKRKVEKIYSALNKFGFRIFKDTVSIKLGKNISSKLNSALEETVKKGVVLVFLSKSALESKWFWKKKSIALRSNALIIPIKLDDVSIEYFPAFRDLSYINMKNGVLQSNLHELINRINQLSDQRFNKSNNDYLTEFDDG